MTNFDSLKNGSVILTDDDYFIFQDKENGFKYNITRAELILALGVPSGEGVLHSVAGISPTSVFIDVFPNSSTHEANVIGLFPEGTTIQSMFGTQGQIAQGSYNNIIARISPFHVSQISIVREPVLSFIDDGATISWTVANPIAFPSDPSNMLFNPIGGMPPTQANAIGHGWLFSDWTFSPDRKTISYAQTVDGTDFGPDDGLFLEWGFIELFDNVGNLYGIVTTEELHLQTLL